MPARRLEMAVGLLLLILTVTHGCSGCASDEQQTAPVDQAANLRIVILYPEPHPVLNEIIDAFETRARGLIAGVEIEKRHASGQASQYPALVRAALQENFAVLAPITTPMSIEVMRQAPPDVRIVFLGVTDPVGAGLVDSLEAPGRSSGVSDNPPMHALVELVAATVPSVKSIGIPYDPSDLPGVLTAKLAERACIERGLIARLRPVTSESEIRSAVRGLAQETDALLIGMDNLMMKNAGLIASTIAPFDRALFAADDKSVEMGAVAGVGVDYRDVGSFGAEIAAEVLLGGRDVGLIPVRQLTTGRAHFNKQTAEVLGVKIPVQ